MSATRMIAFTLPVSRFKQQMGKIVLRGATKDALKAAPKFEYAK